MDFLGLINLTILDHAVKNIEAATGILLDVRKLPLDDAKTFELLGNGECVGVFQLESPPMRRYVSELKPTSVRDLAAMVALYRPGPMAHIPRFVRCKHGLEKIEYPHKWLEEVLAETYGVIVYQDQVMLIAQIIAGYTLGQADILRRAMGKKKKEEMQKQREKFLAGATEKGVSEKVANNIFDLMEPFAGYAFNKAHAVCYAMVAYQTAYLKAHYPVEYMAALLACFIDKTDKLGPCLEECKRLDIPVLPPDVNFSNADFTSELLSASHANPTPDTQPLDSQRKGIRFGLAAIKNVGRGAVEVILKAREEGGPFVSLSDFCHRVLAKESGVGRGTIESLIQCGAFNSLSGHTNRRALTQMLDECCGSAARLQREKKAGQVSLMEMFGSDEGDDGAASASVNTVTIPNVPDFPRDQLLGFEKDLLGLYVSDHPLQAFVTTFERRECRTIAELSELPDRTEVEIGGIITSMKPFTSKKSGQPMCFFTLEDMTGNISCTMFPTVYEKEGANIEKDRIVILRGKTSYRDRVREDEDGGHIVEILADAITPLGGGSSEKSAANRRIMIQLDPTKQSVLRFVRETIESNRGNGGACPVHLRVPDGGLMHEVKTELFAEYNDSFRVAIEKLLGRRTIWVE